MFLALLLATALPAQQDGLTLVSPQQLTDAFLVDTNGNTVRTWNTNDKPGQAAYLSEEGLLYRTIKDNNWPASTIGGSGGGVQIFDFDGNLINTFMHAGNDFLQHHDIAILPNGNFLMLAFERIPAADVIAAGRLSANTGSHLWSEKVIEVDKNTGAHVWEWRVFDHMVQDVDPTLPNYGVIADTPEKININLPATIPANDDWFHFNAIDYNPSLGQIALSSRSLSEIYVIDHNITTAEAAGPDGDFLYRYGNPANYNRGTAANRVLFRQHDIQWIADGLPGAGNMLVFNNGDNRVRPYSTVDEFTPPYDSATDSYLINANGAYGPTTLHWTYNPTTSFFATHTSGCHRQPNGNTLVTNGPAGEVFEVTPTGSVVWNWATSSGGIFKVRKYPASLYRDKLLFAASSGGAINFDLAAGSTHAGRPYLLVGTLSGISPGVNIGNLNIPINPDIFTSFTRNQNSSHIFQDFRGTLDSLGNATATMITGPISTALVGRTMHFAFVLTGPLDFSSNASSVKIVL